MRLESQELAHFALRRRLLVLVLAPLAVLGAINAFSDFRLAGSAARLQDEQLTRLMPLLANAVLAAPSNQGLGSAVVTLVPNLAQFLNERGANASYKIVGANGRLLAGDTVLSTSNPLSTEPELHSEIVAGVTWRVAAMRIELAEGDSVVAQLADSSNARQQWLSAIVMRVVIPNVLLCVAAFFAVRWGVRRALAPLVDLRRQVEARSVFDLSPIDERTAPQEVQPLVRAMNRLVANAQTHAQSQRRFVADAAHQLRTPLAALQAQIEAWGLPPAQALEADELAKAITVPAGQYAKLLQSTRRTSTLVHQLLTLSRADAQNEAPTALEPVDLVALCESVLATQLDTAIGKSIDLGLDVHASCSLVQAKVLANPWLLEELLGNLVDNALHYTPTGGVVTIRVHPHTATGAMPQWELGVQDNGPGILPHERAQVLQRFYRASNAIGPGTGLGLAIADEIARLHGASLQLTSTVCGDSGDLGLNVFVRFSAYGFSSLPSDTAVRE